MINQNARRAGAAGVMARALGTLGAATLLLTSTGWGALAGDTGFGAVNPLAYQGAATGTVNLPPSLQADSKKAEEEIRLIHEKERKLVEDLENPNLTDEQLQQLLDNLQADRAKDHEAWIRGGMRGMDPTAMPPESPPIRVSRRDRDADRNFPPARGLPQQAANIIVDVLDYLNIMHPAPGRSTQDLKDWMGSPPQFE